MMEADRSPKIAEGDFSIGPSDEQHVLDILSSSPGSWRFHPFTGADLASFTLAPVSQEGQNLAARAVEIQMRMDGYELTAFDMTAGKIEFRLI